MLLKITYALLFVALAISQDQTAEVQIPCKTQLNEDANCTDLRECNGLKQMWESGLMSDRLKTYFLKSLCPEKNGRVQICCIYRYKSTPINPRDLLPKQPDCGVSDTPVRLYDGKETRPNQYPWSVMLLYHNATSMRVEVTCGGTLINQRYVLTTAFCASKPGLTRVLLGEWDITTNPDCTSDQQTCALHYIEEDIGTIVVHGEYSAAQMHDIALLRLKSNISYSKSIKPACLPLDNWLSGNQLIDEAVVAVGWGLNERGAAYHRKVKARMNVQNINECNSTNTEDSTSQLCVGSGREGCQGDVGGPLMYTDFNGKVKVDYVVGLTSYGNTNCTLPNNRAVYTRVGAYINWILSEIEP